VTAMAAVMLKAVWCRREDILLILS